MKTLKLLLAAFVTALAGAAIAQDTNVLSTQIAVFEARTGVVIVKGFGEVGAVAFGGGQISVRCKESSDTSTGEKAYGLAVQLDGSPFPQRVLVDDDEMEPLVKAVNYLGKINYNATPLPGFEASFTSKGGLGVIAHSDRKDGAVLTYLQLGYYQPRIALTSVQMTQFYQLLQQAQKNLAALKAGKGAEVRENTSGGGY